VGVPEKALAREVGRHGITVNVVCRGLTETGLLQFLRDQSPKMEQILEVVTRAAPLGRTAIPGYAKWVELDVPVSMQVGHVMGAMGRC
jgi:NAD(P)-dependent dehydrogenase (short-subunit alcohol dehydrogenase family)